jgi:hypothetical protein
MPSVAVNTFNGTWDLAGELFFRRTAGEPLMCHYIRMLNALVATMVPYTPDDQDILTCVSYIVLLNNSGTGGLPWAYTTPNWTEIDQRTDFGWDDDPRTRAFDVSQSVDCKFIRFTQTDTNLDGNDELYFCHFDVFGSVWMAQDSK